MKQIKSVRLGERYTRIDHSSGLTLLLCPMVGFSSAYALFATKYGSVDSCFKTGLDDDFTQVPAGIAHYLEHKMFESEQGDAFARYAATGANANAYASFDRTAYLFSCSDHFAESLDILLDFVTDPYFTEQTVEKERGIIAQEIKMYDDSPEWRVFFNMLGAMYHENPVRVDIAGTVESIAEIDEKLLYRCYNTFYNLRNMVLCVAGGFDPDTVVKAADRILKPAGELKVERRKFHEPSTVRERKVEQVLPVAQPLFHIGFKGVAGASEAQNLYHQTLDELLVEIIAGEASPLYRHLYDQGLINQTFSGEAMASRDYALCFFAGESRDPEQVHVQLVQEIERLKLEGIPEEVFRRCQKALYGRYMSMYGNVNAVAGLMLTCHFAGIEMYELLDVIANATLGGLQDRMLQSFDTDKCSISVVTSGA